MPTRTRAAIVLVTLAATALPAAVPALAADPVEVVFVATGAEQTWVVPDNVSSIHVVLIGGNGGDAGSGGLAHVVTGDLAVAQGTTLFIEVGGKGANSIGVPGAAGGFNGGGGGGSGEANAGAGGGGASDIRTISRTAQETLASRLIVAAGGGGRGGGDLGGEGGSAGSPGSIGEDPTGVGFEGFPGGPGTSLAGGAGGAGGGGAGGAGAGEAGVSGIGGRGSDAGIEGDGGGGGGGGYFGGGGGGGSSFAGGGGGGGGSSFTGTAQNAFVSTNTSANPSITITYTPGGTDPTPAPDTVVVDADVTVPTSAACIELSTTSVTFGTQPFGSENLEATPGITVTNCSGGDESLLARGTDATGGTATWQLVDDTGTCGAGTLAADDYHLRLRRADTEEVTQLSTNNKGIRQLASGASGTLDVLLDMPCPGSSGSGERMGMQIVFIVTE